MSNVFNPCLEKVLYLPVPPYRPVGFLGRWNEPKRGKPQDRTFRYPLIPILFMTILDRHGRLFGKVSILDLGAILIILFVVVGIFFAPGNSGAIRGQEKPQAVEADILVQGVKIGNIPSLISQFSPGSKLSFIIRNQPAGQVDIQKVRQIDRTISVTQPDGSLKVMKDPKPDSYSMDMLLTVNGKGQKTKDGLVLGNTKMKIGTTVEIDQLNYNFNASVIDIRYLDK
jgi:Domain of unknown function (DUF4330)